jgi:hypothetical protein
MGLARGCKEFVIDRRIPANNSGGDSYLRAAEDFMTLSFLSDMEVVARI